MFLDISTAWARFYASKFCNSKQIWYHITLKMIDLYCVTVLPSFWVHMLTMQVLHTLQGYTCHVVPKFFIAWLICPLTSSNFTTFISFPASGIWWPPDGQVSNRGPPVRRQRSALGPTKFCYQGIFCECSSMHWTFGYITHMWTAINIHHYMCAVLCKITGIVTKCCIYQMRVHLIMYHLIDHFTVVQRRWSV